MIHHVMPIAAERLCRYQGTYNWDHWEESEIAAATHPWLQGHSAVSAEPNVGLSVSSRDIVPPSVYLTSVLYAATRANCTQHPCIPVKPKGSVCSFILPAFRYIIFVYICIMYTQCIQVYASQQALCMQLHTPLILFIVIPFNILNIPFVYVRH